MEQLRSLFCTGDSSVARCQSQHLANEFDVRSKLHAQVSLAVVNKILCCSRGYERLQKTKDSLKACFEKINIMKKKP